MFKRTTRGDKVFLIVNAALMVLLCAIILYPVLFVIGRSFMLDAERAVSGLRFIPYHPSLDAYKYIFMRGSYVIRAYGNTIARTILGTALDLVFTIVFAYVLAQRRYPLHKPLTMMVVFTMWFSGGLVPNYMLIRLLHLNNSFWVYILPTLISAWNMLILRNFFMEIPAGLIESATIDGANDLQILTRVVIPTSGAAIATIGLFYAVGIWNAYFDAMVYVSTRRSYYPLSLFLREILILNTTDIDQLYISTLMALEERRNVMKYAVIVVSSLPVMIIYPFVQRFFVKGVMIGAVKG